MLHLVLGWLLQLVAVSSTINAASTYKQSTGCSTIANRLLVQLMEITWIMGPVFLGRVPSPSLSLPKEPLTNE